MTMKALNVKIRPSGQVHPLLENTLKRIRNLYKKFRVWRSMRRMTNPSLINCAMQNIHKIWGNNQIRESFSNELINEVAEQMLTEVVQICSSRTPFIANRARLANVVSELAKYQVLVLEPPPAQDETGLRGAEVTGMLREHILALNNNKNHFNVWGINCDHESPSHESLLDFLLTRYRICKAKAELFLSLEAHLEGSTEHIPEWYGHFMLSMCAHNEHYFRLSLGMPSVLDSDPVRAKIIASEHHIYFNLIKNGVENPHESWEAIVSHIESETINDQLATYHLYVSQYPN